MAHQPKTGAAQSTSMSEFLAKARKLAEAKPVSAPPRQGKTQNFGAATRKPWSRAADAPKPTAAGDDGAPASPPDEAPETPDSH